MTEKPFLFTRKALSDEHYKALGQFIAEFALFEWALGELICLLANLEAIEGGIIRTKLGLHDMLAIAEAIIERKFSGTSIQSRFANVAINIRDAAPIRNRLVHGQWHESDEPGIAFHWDYKTGARQGHVKVRPVKDAEIFGWAEKLSDLTLNVTLIWDEVEASTSPDKSAQQPRPENPPPGQNGSTP